MDLDKLAVIIRPRSGWEGIDLGFAMARQWFLTLWLIWLAIALPVYVIVTLIVSGEPWLVMLILWWCKPLYESALLYWLSRRLFDDSPTIKSIIRQLWKVVKPGLLGNLTWRRLSPNRSFYMPVINLEGLKGKPRRNRIKVLGNHQHAGFWLTWVGAAFEGVIELSILVLIIMMLPEELHWFEIEDIFFGTNQTLSAIENLGYLLGMSIIAPYYVSAGFALYLTRRSELEAWDIEINFRRMATRSQEKHKTPTTLLTSFLLMGILFLSPVSDSQALEVTSIQAKEAITSVLSHEDFGKESTEKYWKYIGPEVDESDPGDWEWLWDSFITFMEGFNRGFANIGSIILWIAGGGLFIYLVYLTAKNRGWLTRRSLYPTLKQHKTPETLFGMAVTPDSLPKDIPSALADLIKQGQLREALSLLYRACLVNFIHREQLDIPNSATETECLALVINAQPKKDHAFFKRLTRSWILSAYGHVPPAPNELEKLCAEWCETENKSAYDG